MKISLEWLNEYIDLSDVTPEQIAHELTMSGLEVEEIEDAVYQEDLSDVTDLLKQVMEQKK